MPKVTAIIHVTQRSRFVPGRYGQFVRPDGQPLHLWLGRELTIAEFNEQWPKAVKSVPDTVHVKIIERPDESDTILKSDHEQAMSAVQAGVDEFTKQCNDIIATKDARISELEKPLAAVPTTPLPVLAEPVVEVVEQVTEKPVVEPVIEEAPKTEVIAEASPAVVVDPAAAPAEAPAPAAAPKAAAKKAGPKPPKNTDSK